MTGTPGSDATPIPRAVEQVGVSSPGPNRIECCDLCGSTRRFHILDSTNLDGPLVRCAVCGMHYIGIRFSDLAFGAESSQLTADRVRRANARFQHFPIAEERRLSAMNARWRLDLIRRHRPSGRLLDVGCGWGDFLMASVDYFDAYGVEPNPELAKNGGDNQRIHCGVIQTAPWSDFDVVTSFHVIEHVNSPAELIEHAAQRLKSGGLLAMETPDIGSWAYRVFRSRWRQFIPEHYHFFDRTTLTRLLSERGFRVFHSMNIGKYASFGLVLHRLGRQIPLFCRVPVGDGSYAFRFNPRDILLVLATRS